MTTTNQRQHERVRAPKIQVRVASLDRLRAFYLDDLSQGGIFIRTDKPLAVGAQVEIDLIPPEMPVVPLRGAVVRTLMDDASRAEKRSGMAVRFEGLSKEAEQALASLIARLRQPAAAAPVPAAAAASAVAENPQRISTLEMELADLKGKVEAYEQQNRQLQDDEDTARHLAERIAQEKSELAQQFDKFREKSSADASRTREEVAQAHRHTEEIKLQVDTLEQTLATVETALDTERREHENTTVELTAVRSKGGSSEAALERLAAEVKHLQATVQEERARAERLQQSVEEERGKAEQARTREREVRRLLTMVSGRPDAAPAVTAPAPAASAVAEPEPEPPPSVITSLPPWPLAEASPASLEVDFDIAFQEPAAAVEATEPALSFSERLRATTRIVRTERFNAHTPTDPTESLVFDLLSRVETMEELTKWTSGKVPTDRLVQIVQSFHARQLIELT